MTSAVLLLLQLLSFSHSAPDPDTHLHVHLPAEGEIPNTGGGLAAHDDGRDYGMITALGNNKPHDYIPPKGVQGAAPKSNGGEKGKAEGSDYKSGGLFINQGL